MQHIDRRFAEAHSRRTYTTTFAREIAQMERGLPLQRALAVKLGNMSLLDEYMQDIEALKARQAKAAALTA